MTIGRIAKGTLLAACLAQPVAATDNCTADAMVVFDGSGSMAEMGFNLLNEPRIMSARRAVIQAVPPIAEHRRLGLIIYGPGTQAACSNIDLRFAPLEDAAQRIIDAVDHLDPAGDTPLTAAVELGAMALDHKSKPGVILLVTDGKDTCGGQPCQTAARLYGEARNLTIHVIGFKVQGDHFAFPNAPTDEKTEGVAVAKCMADITGGKYVSAQTVDELQDAFRETLGCSLIGRRETRAG